MRATWRLALLLAVAVGAQRNAYGVDASNVLLLYNAASADGAQIANYYASVHPGVQLLGINGIGTSEYITADDFLSIVRPQVLSVLTPQLSVIGTTKGMPLRVHVTEPAPTATFPNLPTYTDPYGQQHSILSWKPYSSLESELANIDTVASWEMMGDQSYTLAGHFVRNPYYNATTPFTHEQYGTRLTARLDGYSVDDVLGAIDRAQNAFVGPSNSSGGARHFVVDNDPTRPYDVTMTRLVDDVLAPSGVAYTYDDTASFVGAAPGPVIAYDGHGAHQASTPANYITSGFDFTLADGAVFTSLESYNAYSFTPGGYTGNQGQVAQWLEIGGTAGVGYVSEPTASWVTVSNEDILFGNLLAGRTFAESAWAANYQTSYVNTVIGDPLMTWRMLIYGDVNADGHVDISDLSIMGAHWAENSAAGGFGWGIGDINSDGVVDISDLSLLGANWGATAPWADGQANVAGITAEVLGSIVQSYIHPIPEPASAVLFLAAILSLLGLRFRVLAVD
jgi:uncharacterized protein (TIGR03790 family)